MLPNVGRQFGQGLGPCAPPIAVETLGGTGRKVEQKRQDNEEDNEEEEEEEEDG